LGTALVLDQYPDSIPCYIGRGYVFAGEQRWAEATVEFEKVIELEGKKRGPGSLIEEGKPAGSVWSPLETEAKEQQGWCLVKQGRLEEGKAILDSVSEVFDVDTTRGEDSARVWWRKGIADWEMGGKFRPPRRLAVYPIWHRSFAGDHRNNAYEAFVASLRHFDSFASSYTAMGVWYLDHADPPDEDRASKCFQKAFELDATQGDAARRLAEGYAKEAEWALVNVISKRVMEGEGGLEGGLSSSPSGTTGKFLPTNAWAWKASGAVQMVSQSYAQGSEDRVLNPSLWAGV
jgi:superkiller protein 3